MLGLGWGEMLVIAVVLLIAVGPKDLPVLLRNLGKMMGSVRRMSNEFRREIDKAIAADEFKEAKKAISDPLKQTSAEITREFNAIRKDGTVEPTGKIKPSEPGKESVFDEIRAQAGMTEPAPGEPSKAAAAITAQVKARTVKAATPAASVEDAPKAAAGKPAAKKPAAKKAPAKKPAVKAAASEAAPKAAKPKAAKDEARAPAKKARVKAAAGEVAPKVAKDEAPVPAKKAPARKKAAKPAEAEAGKD